MCPTSESIDSKLPSQKPVAPAAVSLCSVCLPLPVVFLNRVCGAMSESESVTSSQLDDIDFAIVSPRNKVYEHQTDVESMFKDVRAQQFRPEMGAATSKSRRMLCAVSLQEKTVQTCLMWRI